MVTSYTRRPVTAARTSSTAPCRLATSLYAGTKTVMPTSTSASHPRDAIQAFPPRGDRRRGPRSQRPVQDPRLDHGALGQDRLHVDDDAASPTTPYQINIAGGVPGPERGVGDGDHDPVVAGVPLEGTGDRRDPRLGDALGVGDRIVDHRVHAVALQLSDEVEDPRVPDVADVLLEGEPEDEDPGTPHRPAPPNQELHRLLRDVGAHRVVDPAPGQDDLGIVAELLRPEGQVVGIHRNAVPAHQPRLEG